MLELVAENAAIDDLLYHADRAMANGSVDVTTFLRVGGDDDEVDQSVSQSTT